MNAWPFGLYYCNICLSILLQLNESNQTWWEIDIQIINIHEAKMHLLRLFEAAAQGNAFIIVKAGKPMVKVSPLTVEECSGIRRFGFMSGEIVVPDDFDTT